MNKSNVHFVRLAVAVREACYDMYTIISDKARTEKDNETLRKEIAELRLTLASLHEREDEALAIVDEAYAACEASRLQQEELEQANTKLVVSIGDLNNAMLTESLHLSQKLSDAYDQVCILSHENTILRARADSIMEFAQCLMDTLDLFEQDYLQMVNSKDAEILRLEQQFQHLRVLIPSPSVDDTVHIAPNTSPFNNPWGLGVISHVLQRCTKKE